MTESENKSNSELLNKVNDVVIRIRPLWALSKFAKISQKQSFKVFLSDEFNQPLTLPFTATLSFKWIFIETKLLRDIPSWPLENWNSIEVSSDMKSVSLPLEFPNQPTTCSLFVECTFSATDSNKSVIIMNYLSNIIHVVEIVEASFNIEKLLTSYRIFGYMSDDLYSFNENNQLNLPILIKEDYGATLGSHVYDSSIILLKYLRSNKSLFETSRSGLAIELGAGCGLLSIFLTKLFNHVISSDKDCQIPLLENNFISNNIPTSLYSVISFDWGNSDHIELIQAKQRSLGVTNLIVAGDVFYDNSITELFFRVLVNLAQPETIIILAQKIRVCKNDLSQYALRKSFFVEFSHRSGFDCVMVWEEASVVVWRLAIRK